MLSALLVAALFVSGQAPPAPAPSRLKVLVLDVSSADLTESERTTLTNLEAAQLSEDPRLEVLSGEDLKQLVKLQGQAQEIGVEGCTDSCMAELAGALGAGVVISTQAGKLGETFVVTLVVFDAAKAKGVSRKSIQATSLGELPGKLGPALTALVGPLLAAPPAPVAGPTPTAVAAPPAPAVMSPRVQELFDVEAVQVCFDEQNRAAWWFCNRKQAFTENAFIRDYRALTGSHDLDDAERERGVNVLVPVGLAALAAAAFGAAAVAAACGAEDAPCGEDAGIALDDNEPLGIVLLAGGLTVGIIGATGAIVTSTTVDSEGTREMHTLTESEARGAIGRYNDALKLKLARDLGES